MNSIFSGCRNINYLPDISNWDTSKVIDMKYMFMGNYVLVSLSDISKWNTQNVRFMTGKFAGCRSLKSLPMIDKWDIRNLQDCRTNFNEINPDLLLLPILGIMNTVIIMKSKMLLI